MRLRWQRRALRQVETVLEFVAARSPQGAAQIEARLRAITTLLQLQKFAGRKTSLPEVRRIFLTPYPYLIDYFVGEEEVVIQRFRHSARKPL